MTSLVRRLTLVVTALSLVVAATACNKDATTKDDEQPAAKPAAADAKPAAKKADDTKKAAPEEAKKAEAAGFDHSGWDGLLKKYVTDKGVNYSAFKADKASMSALDAYLESVAKADLEKMKGDEKLAFYINAYNAHTVKAVIANYPTKSVMDVKGFFKELKHDVGGNAITLDALENKRIRGEFSEARIHFVVNCASASCPKLVPTAITPANMEKEMEAATLAYIKQETTYDAKANKIVTSKIFEWFKGDFEKSAGSVNKFIAKYSPDDKKALAEKATIETSEYGWALNEVK